MNPNNIVFQKADYQYVLDRLLRGDGMSGGRRPRGAIKKLAEHLRCHPTFIAQVLADKAHLSIDQSMATAAYFQLSDLASDHFLDLVLLARVSTPVARRTFRHKIHKRLDQYRSLREHLTAQPDLQQGREKEFFSSWQIQAIYSRLHIDPHSHARELALALAIPEAMIKEKLRDLKDLGLLKTQMGRCEPKQSFLHLDSKSPNIASHHRSWRCRTLQQFDYPIPQDSFHYAGAMTISRHHKEQARCIMLSAVAEIQSLVKKSSSEQTMALIVDLFALD